MVPFINVVCVWILAKYGGGGASTLNAVKEMGRNPLIIACVAGIVVNLSGLGLAAPAQVFFDLVGRAAPPVGLLCVGAGLDIVAARAGRVWVGLSAILNLVAMPLIALGFAELLGLTGAAAYVLVIFYALPTAPSAYILARQMGGDARLMGGDARLMGGILTTQTAMAIVTLPLWISLLAP